jgi:5-formyltetrahydrofolate cyclo-ligase
MTVTAEPDTVSAKAALRARLKSVRDALSETDRSNWSAAIGRRVLQLEVVRSARRVFAFISNGTEVHTHDLIHRLLADGKEVAVPKIIGKTPMIACRLRDWSDLKPAQLGILTPAISDPMEGAFDVVITPGLGFTPLGQRIGYGAGYYDGWFATHEAHYKIAVAFEAQIVPTMPTTRTDVPVDAIATESRLIIVNPAVR